MSCKNKFWITYCMVFFLLSSEIRKILLPRPLQDPLRKLTCGHRKMCVIIYKNIKVISKGLVKGKSSILMVNSITILNLLKFNGKSSYTCLKKNVIIYFLFAIVI